LTFPLPGGIISGVSSAASSKTGNASPALGQLLLGRSQTPVSESEWVELVHRIGQQDQIALQVLYDRTNRLVFTLVMRITADREAAEEVTLDVFHEIWQRASTYDPVNGTVAGWIMNQARSRACDRVRFDHRKKRSGNVLDLVAVPDAADDPLHAVQLRERQGLVRNAIENLSAEERKVVECAFFSDLTHQEVADQLNQPLGTVKTRIRSALAKLRHAVGRELKEL